MPRTVSARAAVIERNTPRAVGRRQVNHLLRQLAYIAAELRGAGMTSRQIIGFAAGLGAEVVLTNIRKTGTPTVEIPRTKRKDAP